MPEHAVMSIEFRLNGEMVELSIDPTARLLDVLRNDCRLTGTKEGCGEGECGACTVYLDHLPVNSCLVPAFQARGRDVRTVESLDPDSLTPFLAGGTTQCGACTPGVVMTANWLRDHPQLLDRFPLRALMAGNLCRCTGYDGIIDSTQRAIDAVRDSNA